MQEKGSSENEVLSRLKKAREKDLKYSEGKIFSSMCTKPHPFSEKVYPFFSEINLGDAGLFKGTKELEKEAIKMIGSMLGKKSASGFIVSGGTEANIMALWAARNMSGKKSPCVIVPESAHFSFEKAADLAGLRLIKARCARGNSVDIKDVTKKIDRNTAAIVGIAGSTEYGTIDDIESLSEIAVKKNIYLHVDAAFGGFVIPFLRDLGYESKKFDFSLEGVCSITIDPHKMGLAPIPSGGILFRNSKFLNYIESSSPYLTEKKQYTLTGTRSGASVASTFSILKLLGKDGYLKNVEKCMRLTTNLYNELKKMKLEVFKPTMNILVFNHEKNDEISRRLEAKGWSVSRTRNGEIRLVVMPHIGEESVSLFTNDLRKVLHEI